MTPLQSAILSMVYVTGEEVLRPIGRIYAASFMLLTGWRNSCRWPNEGGRRSWHKCWGKAR